MLFLNQTQTQTHTQTQPTMSNPTRPVSSFLPSPRFFNTLFSPKPKTQPQPEPDSESSPTSTLDNPFQTPKNPTQIHPQPDPDPEGIALALIDPQPDQTGPNSKPNAINRKVLLASNLKIQIPEFSGDYGIKTRSPHFAGRVGSPVTGSGLGSGSGRISWEEMELSEEYTRVVCRGPNPKTTHIFDNCVVENCCGVVGSGSGSGSGEMKKPGPKQKQMCEGLLSYCCTCKRRLEDGCDILIYRGDKAFCSEECRCKEMILDGLMMN